MLLLCPCCCHDCGQVAKDQYIKLVYLLLEPFTVENGLAMHLVGDADALALNRKVMLHVQ